jgi:microcompartment protein CcmL/EutN
VEITDEGNGLAMNPTRPPVGPALAMLVVDDIPAGYRALDAMLKEAPVELIGAGTIQYGFYMIVIAGGVEAVERSMHRALGSASPHTVDSVLLADAEPRILPSIRDAAIRWPAPGDTLGSIQVGTPPGLLRAVDRALKGTSVELVEMRLGDGLGGRAVASFWGETSDVEAAITLARGGASDADPIAGVSTSIIRNADPELATRLGAPTTFFKGWRG